MLLMSTFPFERSVAAVLFLSVGCGSEVAIPQSSTSSAGGSTVTSGGPSTGSGTESVTSSSSGWTPLCASHGDSCTAPAECCGGECDGGSCVGPKTDSCGNDGTACGACIHNSPGLCVRESACGAIEGCPIAIACAL